jgi:hypothetical protein
LSLTPPSSRRAAHSNQRDPVIHPEFHEDLRYCVATDRTVVFEALEHLAPIEAIAAFELRRQMTSTGIFKAIEAFTPLPGSIEGQPELLQGCSDIEVWRDVLG